MRKRYLYGIIILLLVSVVFSVGCSVGNDVRSRNQKDDNLEDQPLLILHKNNSLLLSQFQNAYPNVEIQIVDMSNLGAGDPYENCVRQYGYPDIILLNQWTANLEYYYEEDRIDSLNEYFMEDAEFDESNYVYGVADVGRIKGDLYALPLSVNIPYMTIREDLWETSAFAEMPENYTAFDLLDAMNQELDKVEEATDFTVFPLLDRRWNLVDWFYTLDVFQENRDNIKLDEELFEKLYDVRTKNEKNRIGSMEYFGSFVSGGFGAAGGNMYLAVNYGELTSPQTGMVLSESLNQGEYQKGIKVLWYPTAYDSEVYKAEVETFGAIGVESVRKQEAYEVLRMMMDMPYTTYILSNDESISEATHCPVNKKMAVELLNLVENEGNKQLVDYKTAGYSKNYDVPKRKISNTLRNEFEFVIENVVLYRTKEDSLEREIKNVSDYYIDNLMEHYESCYEEIKSLCE